MNASTKTAPVEPQTQPQTQTESTLPRSSEIVVIGAGLVGTSIAYQLAKRGKKVLVIEKRGICSGASGRNGGMTGAGSMLQMHAADAVNALTSLNFEMLQTELASELNDTFSLRVTGGLDIATDEEQATYLKNYVSESEGHGAHVEWLDTKELQEFVPAIFDQVFGAKMAYERGHLWPFQLVHSLADGARRYEAEFALHTSVTGVRSENGKITGVQTDRGIVETATVVLATNAWTPQLAADLPDGAIVPSRGQILVTQPVADILPMPFSSNFDKEYGRQTHSGQILSGGFRRRDIDEGLGHYDEYVHPPAQAGIAGCLTTMFPQMKDLRIVRSWAGIMGFTADGLPMIGPYGENNGLYMAAGFNGGGFSWGAATGKAMAQLICHGTSTLNLEPFDPNRFASGEMSWDNPFTAGEKNNPGGLV